MQGCKSKFVFFSFFSFTYSFVEVVDVTQIVKLQHLPVCRFFIFRGSGNKFVALKE